MSKNHGVLCQKVVRSTDIKIGDPKLPEISDELRQFIRERQIQSLLGLVGPGAQLEMRRLVEHYWSKR